MTKAIINKSSATHLSTKVRVNEFACGEVATILSRGPIPPAIEAVSPPSLDRLQSGNFYLLLVAICHQTSPVGKLAVQGVVNNNRLKGWDYISAKLAQAAQSDSSLLSPSQWIFFTDSIIDEIFEDKVFGRLLTDSAGRAALVRNLGQTMQENDWPNLEGLYNEADGWILGRPRNLLSLLSKIRAYDDPVKKKSFFLLALMKNSGIWSYADDQNLLPPVDYHEVRGHLRLGTVDVVDDTLRKKLLAKEMVSAEDDLDIRFSVQQAITSIAKMVGSNPNTLHYLFWNIFRSCCTRESPHCHGCPPTCTLASQYVSLATASGSRKCPLSNVCASADATHRFDEHMFETDYY